MKKQPVVRMQVRYKHEIHQWLNERAKQNNRSMNGELMDILLRAKEDEAQTNDKAA